MSKRIYENPVFGDVATFIKTSEETNGEYSLLEIQLVPGGENFLHTHTTFSETFRPVEGQLSVQVNKEKMRLEPGQEYTVPRNTKHHFGNATGKPIKFMVELRPGHTGFENALKIAYGLAKDGLTNKNGIPKSFAHLSLLVLMSDTYPSGVGSVMLPIIKWKAKQAMKKGIDKMLVERYCR